MNAKRYTVLAMVLVASAACALDPTVATIDLSQNTGRIVYHQEGQQDKLFLFDPETGARTLLASSNYRLEDPSWSYNGRYVVFIQGEAAVSMNSNAFSIVKILDRENGYSEAFDSFFGAGIYLPTATKYPDWSPDGSRIVVWAEDKITLIEFPGPYDFSSATARTLVPDNFDGAGATPVDGQFDASGQYVYFFASGQNYTNALYRAPVDGGAPEFVLDQNGGVIEEALHPSISPTGRFMIFNSEQYALGTPGYQDEELMRYDFSDRSISNVSNAPGHQSGRYAKDGQGNQILMQDRTPPTGPQSLYLLIGEEKSLAVEPDLNSSIEGADWYIPSSGPYQ